MNRPLNSQKPAQRGTKEVACIIDSNSTGRASCPHPNSALSHPTWASSLISLCHKFLHLGESYDGSLTEPYVNRKTTVLGVYEYINACDGFLLQ